MSEILPAASGFQQTYERISEILSEARGRAYRAINAAMVAAYWEIGRVIVEEEQKGQQRAEYGTGLLVELSQRLTADFGKGFDRTNLQQMRAFYSAYQIRDALRHELSWTHYRLLLRVERPEARAFYAAEAVNARWSTRELERQIHSLQALSAHGNGTGGRSTTRTASHRDGTPTSARTDPMNNPRMKRGHDKAFTEIGKDKNQRRPFFRSVRDTFSVQINFGAIMEDVWSLVKEGKFESACELADQEFAKSGSELPLRNKVLALLNLQRFDDASRLCVELVRMRDGETDRDFIMLGVAYWLLEKRDEAVAAWQRATKSKYTDAAGGVTDQLLLLYAAVQMHDEEARLALLKGLKKFAKRRSTQAWPGPLAALVLGNLTESDVQSKLSSNPILRTRQACVAHFYAGLLRLMENDSTGFEGKMRQACSEGSARLHPEYYLAKSVIG